MSYNAIALMANDVALRNRVAACAAQETLPDGVHSAFGPEALMWAHTNIWGIAAQPAWGTTWQYALDTDNASPGDDPAVITDGMILAAVQAFLAAQTPTE